MGRAAETPREDWDKIAFAIRQIRLRLDELERPTGSQRMNAGARLQAIEAAVEERWINDEIETRIQTAVNAALAAAFSGNVQITGSLTVNGALAAASLTTAGALTVGGAVTLPGAASATQAGTITPAVYGAGGKLGKA